jgi:hypothetical protein
LLSHLQRVGNDRKELIRGNRNAKTDPQRLPIN